MEITFPKNIGQRYYDTHYRYISDLFYQCNYKVNYNSYIDLVIEIDNKLILFDYYDNINCLMGSEGNLKSCDNILNKVDKIFKFHYSKEVNYGKYNDKIISFTPISFYFNTENPHNYIKPIPNRVDITNRQIPYGNATNRRKYVHKLLNKSIDYCKFDYNIIDRYSFFNEANYKKLAIFIGGYSNNILDRGQLQYMALGCPTVSTLIPESIAYNQDLIPNKHYLLIKDDFSDMNQKIKEYYYNDNLLTNVKTEARLLFQETSTPTKLLEWIKMNI